MSDTEREFAGLVFKRSLANLRTFFPDRPVLVVYIPSPFASYRLLSQGLLTQIGGNKRLLSQELLTQIGLFPIERVAEYSDRMCQIIRAATISQDAGFLDLRPAIRVATAQEVLHGPRDFKHFNRKGYEVLGRSVAERFDSPLVAQECAEISVGLNAEPWPANKNKKKSTFMGRKLPQRSWPNASGI